MKKYRCYCKDLTVEDCELFIKGRNMTEAFDEKHPDCDSYSKELYDDLESLYSKREINGKTADKTDVNKEQYSSSYSRYDEHGEIVNINKASSAYVLDFTIDGTKFRFGSDYIGPSVYWAYEAAKVSGERMHDFLTKARTIGGHILLPRVSGSINQVRGGENGVFDRIDWTLLLLKAYLSLTPGDRASFEQFLTKVSELIHSHSDVSYPKDILVSEYDKKHEGYKELWDSGLTKDYKAVFRLFKAFRKSEEWLGLFDGFEDFCDFFFLKWSFADEAYNIILHAPLFPVKPVDYEKYIDNNISSITKRNASIEAEHR